MRRLRWAALGLVIVLALAYPLPAFAQAGDDGRVVLGGDFTLRSGEVLNGDLVVLGGNAELEAGSLVRGDLFVMGGNVTAGGEVTGDVAVIGGNVDLLDNAIVRGDVVAYGGNISRASGAQVDGDFLQGDGVTVPFDFEFGRVIRPPFGNLRFEFSPLIDILWFLFRTLLLGALAVLVVMFWPGPTATTAEAIVDQPVVAGGFGLLTLFVAPVLLVMLLITIILSPLSLLGVILLVVAATFGWIAIGQEVGQRLATAFKWELHPAAAAGLGTLVFTFVLGGVGLIPCLGWIAVLLGLSLGLGGVLLTRFGTRPYRLESPATPAPPPEPEPPKPKRGGRKK